MLSSCHVSALSSCQLYSDRRAELLSLSAPLKVTCFGTSIWDETLYKAWSSIVYALVPNVEILESHLDHLCTLCAADEIVLFEKATFLVISHATHTQHEDVHRYEKISNIIKQFKLSCSKSQAQFMSMQVENKYFTAFIDQVGQSGESRAEDREQREWECLVAHMIIVCDCHVMSFSTVHDEHLHHDHHLKPEHSSVATHRDATEV